MSISELLVMVAVFGFLINLLLTGIIGLVKKEINPQNLAVSVIFAPLGFVGWFVTFLHNSAHKQADKGVAGVASSMAAIGFALFGLIVAGFFYASTYELLSNDVIEVLVPALFWFVIVLIISGIVYFGHIRKSNI